MFTDAIQSAAFWLSDRLDVASFEVRGMAAVVLVSVICGSIGPMVVGNRMAFFSDAMAHVAFAGVTLGILSALVTGALDVSTNDPVVLGVMVGFGIAIGFGIEFVRSRTGLSSDTVIGVFFAAALGLGALLFNTLRAHSRLDPEVFIFGSPIMAEPIDIILLLELAGLTLLLLLLRYNQYMFASFNASLARSRRIPLRLQNYAFIVLLALIVNLSVRAVGALLINALLVVPAAAACNICRNMRQLFWVTVLLNLLAGVVGLLLSRVVAIPLRHGQPLRFGPSGLVVLMTVLFFFLSMLASRYFKGRQPA
jgi:zinc transport system permease protein